MDDTFKIFVQRLSESESEEISEVLDPAFLDVHEKELSFKSPVKVEGVATVTDGALILNLAVQAEATIPCAICNEPVNVAIEISDFCHTEQFEQIKSGVYDYSGPLREVILLEVPQTAECHQGKCPEREKLAKYLK